MMVFVRSVSGLRTILLMALATGVAACASPASQGPKPTVKQAVETAPADLQLSCAAETALRFSVDGVLPINSALEDTDVFRVELTSQTGGFACQINRDGTIVSIVPSALPTTTVPAQAGEDTPPQTPAAAAAGVQPVAPSPAS